MGAGASYSTKEAALADGKTPEEVEAWITENPPPGKKTVEEATAALVALPEDVAAGAMVMILPAEADRDKNDPGKLYPGFYQEAGKAVFMDDGTKFVCDVAAMGVPSVDEVSAQVTKYSNMVEKITASFEDEAMTKAIDKAWAHVTKVMGGSLGEGEKINYAADAGAEAKEGALLVNTLVGNLPIAGESMALRSMCGKWQAVCKENDADASGTISKDEAKAVWAGVLSNGLELCTAQLEACNKALEAMG